MAAHAVSPIEPETSTEPRRILVGEIEHLPLPELIQFFHLQGFDGTLALSDPLGEPIGAIFYLRRQIIHALFRGRQGSEAVYLALGLQKGRFEFLGGTPLAPVRTVNESVQNLILEGLRRLDAGEAGHVEKLLPPDGQPVYLAPEPPQDDIRLTAKEWRVLSLVNGKRTIQQIVEHSRKREEEVRPILAGLLAADLILIEKDTSYLDAIVLDTAIATSGGVRFAAPTLLGTLILKRIDGQKTLRDLLTELNLPEDRAVEDIKALVKLGRIEILAGHFEFERWAAGN